MPKLTLNCPVCSIAPVRKDEGLDTWLECPSCGLKGTSCNRMSDDYAFTNSESYWNSTARRTA